MKRILITGENSYIGNSFADYLCRWPDQYLVEKMSLKKDHWRDASFRHSDVILHVAGIAHVSTDRKLEGIYFKVNRDLAIETARKAKEEGVGQFIFLSSIIVYGADDAASSGMTIDETTTIKPVNPYGRSKLEAESGILELTDDCFKVVILRLPIVYGPGCKGNFPRLLKLAKYALFFPNIENQRSMIYIENLNSLIKSLIDQECYGLFFPQNNEYVSTKNVILSYRKIIGKHTYLFPFPKSVMKLLSRIEVLNKAFGTKIYAKSVSGSIEYCTVNFEESMRRMIDSL